MKKYFKIIVTVSFLLCFFFNNAQERILNFDTTIKIEHSGVIQVNETITIKAEGQLFVHGLLRQLPLNRKDIDGNAVDVGYTLQSIKKDGVSENYFTKEADGDFKIYIGDKDIDLPSGIYEYEIVYTVPFQIGYFDSYDELYWNVTGNGWDIPIDKASCTLYLPNENATFGNVNAYTGYEGDKGSQGTASLDSNKTIAHFYVTGLGATQGLTVAASFDKGIVLPPSKIQEASSFYKKIKNNLWSTVFGLGMLLFYFFQWKKKGKDPVIKTIVPEFRPPFDWSPAIVGYVYNRAVTDGIYMASMVQVAIKGAIKITSTIEKSLFTTSTVYQIEVLNASPNNLSEEEKALFKPMASRKKIIVSQTSYRVFEKAYKGWLSVVTKKINVEDYYINNGWEKTIGFLIFINVGLVFLILSHTNGYMNYFFYIVLVIGSSSLTYWVSKTVKGSGWIILRGILCFMWLLPAIFIYFASLFFRSWIEIGVQVAVFIGYLIYSFNLGKYTVKGAESLERLEGFKLYLETAEKNKMNMLKPPELTPALFEELLPYAVALEVDVAWGKQFETILELAKYDPSWYSGDDGFRNSSHFISSISKNVSNSRVDPTPSRSSSSSSSGSSGSWSGGSSGGGSSGGGGGGGGGGGW
ncbi:hypothetical protein FFWV33_01345 [Flavobacterium faecale]|uniref:Transmembrane signal peptide protein n=1 Tax=Flavobacterium faecale TaxID=1355330 RepID=A0A2S1L9M1_9FLAO|nr:DUF2207 domain-containing protein [Flavobacterium faecale]AWG20266.1 hypothetical protein FFWV33_01345 [Flavobacterium faecale]